MKNTIYLELHIYNCYEKDYLFRFINNSYSVANSSEDIVCIMVSQDTNGETGHI